MTSNLDRYILEERKGENEDGDLLLHINPDDLYLLMRKEDFLSISSYDSYSGIRDGEVGMYRGMIVIVDDQVCTPKVIEDTGIQTSTKNPSVHYWKDKDE